MTKKIAVLLSQRNNSEKYKAIIDRAALNGYHDFKFDTIPGHPEYGDCICPKAQLVSDLSAFPELEDIRMDVINGKYDESPDAEDDAKMRLYLMQEGVPDKLYDVLGFDKPTQQDKDAVNAAPLN
jgi:hypothetical protein